MNFEELKYKISSEKSEGKLIALILELGDYKTEESKNFLMSSLSTINSFVRDAIVISLVRIGDVQFLCSNISHEHRYVRRGIVQALGEIGGEVACLHLVQSLGDQEWGVRMYAAESLGKVGSDRDISDLRNLLDDEHEWPREVARQSLNKLSDNSSGKSYH